MRGSDVIDFDDPERNMYGCAPCPECGSVYRWWRQRDHVILCDDCGFEECGRLAENES